MVFGITCICILLSRNGMETRFLNAEIFLLAWSAVPFFAAFTPTSIDEQAAKITDERDNYIAMKSSRKTLRIMSTCMATVCFINVFLYAVLRQKCSLP